MDHYFIYFCCCKFINFEEGDVLWMILYKLEVDLFIVGILVLFIASG